MIPVPDVGDIQLVFGSYHFTPAWEDIPEEFKQGHTQWNKLFQEIFYKGVPPGSIEPKEGVDAGKAGRAIMAAIASRALKHEHKEAGVAYLLSQWFKEWTPDGNT